MELAHRWVLWETTSDPEDKALSDASYMGSLRRFATISTVEDFWALWHYLPPPSLLFSDQRTERFVTRKAPAEKLEKIESAAARGGSTDHIPSPWKDDLSLRGSMFESLEAIALFRDGVAPAWENEFNREGGDLSIRRAFSAEQLDGYWTSVALAAIGEILEDDVDDIPLILGVRIAGKSSPGHRAFRLEVWLSSRGVGESERLAKAFRSILLEGSPHDGEEDERIPTLSFRSHV